MLFVCQGTIFKKYNMSPRFFREAPTGFALRASVWHMFVVHILPLSYLFRPVVEILCQEENIQIGMQWHD